MKTFGVILWVAALASGCATPSTIESRKAERPSAYAALQSEQRALIDKGQIKIGMPEDAAYIAWGSPAQILKSESAAGQATAWIYTGTGYQEFRYWNYRWFGPGYGQGYRGYGYVQPLPTLDYEYVPYRYTSAEVVFEQGVVKSWKHITPPRK